VESPSKPSARRRAEEPEPARIVGLPAPPEPVVLEVCDGLGDTLQLLARRLDHMLRSDAAAECGEDLLRTRQSVTEVLRTLRQVADAFDSHRLMGLGLRGALRHIVADLERTVGTYAELKTRGSLARVPVATANVLVNVARVCAVDLQRHARSSVLLLSVRVDEHHLVLNIRDDGVDLAQRQGLGWRSAGHMNLAALARTVERHGGTFRVSACRPRGLSFRAVLPLAAAHPAPTP
jgi:signal transduction histidine kinase